MLLNAAEIRRTVEASKRLSRALSIGNISMRSTNPTRVSHFGENTSPNRPSQCLDVFSLRSTPMKQLGVAISPSGNTAFIGQAPTLAMPICSTQVLVRHWKTR